MKFKNSICPIFIGGTGRSGTTILSKILSKHNLIYSFPQELRFITDPDGLISLKNALVDNWSFFHADITMERFVNLMSNLRKKYYGKYPNNGLSGMVGEDFYSSWTQSYYDQVISECMHNGWAGRVNVINKLIIKYLGINMVTKPFIPRAYYCPPLTSEKYNSITKDFILEYYNQAAKIKNASFVVEHTPYNLLHFKFINEIIPHSKLIHIYRDPRDVVCSYRSKDWGREDVMKNAFWIRDVFSSWEELKVSLSTDNYLEISFEKLISDYQNELKRICNFLDIQFSESFLEIDVTKHNIGRWKKDFKDDEKKILTDFFSDMIENYGYNQ